MPANSWVVGANHAGEFIRRYSPHVVVGANHAGEFIGRRRGESCRRIYSPLFAPCLQQNFMG